MFIFKGLVSKAVSVNLHEAVVVELLLLTLGAYLYHYLDEVRVVIHELLRL